MFLKQRGYVVYLGASLLFAGPDPPWIYKQGIIRVLLSSKRQPEYMRARNIAFILSIH